ncbi:MAG: MOP flippase family protein, partial [Candidatus Omnitrophica bacterium]|nr:MOP flippase family protein [Candidatus Omnitrophota bacterium]
MMNLKQRAVNGLFWSFLSQGGKQAGQFIVVAVLVRLLDPAEFGLLAMAAVFTEFANVFVEMGVGSALIQKQDATSEHYNSAFWLNLILGIGMMAALVLVAPLIAMFYEQPKLKLILIVLAFNFVLTPFSVVQQALLMKEMEFRKLAVRDIAVVFVSGILGIVLAIRGWGVWALVVQAFAATITDVLILWMFSSWRPRRAFSCSCLKEIFPFGANLTGFNILNYFARNMDKLLIGRFLGPQALGFYSLAYRMVLFPLQNISWSIGRVMFPAFSKIQQDIDKVRIVYLKMIGKIAFVTFPLMAVIFVCAPEIVTIFFGDRWTGIVILLRIFSFCGMVQSIGTTIGNILLSQGRADWQFRMQMVGTLIVFLSIAAGMRWGVTGVAAAYTI